MLVCAHDSGIDHHVFVIGIACQQLENTLENPALGPPAEALVDDFPIPETRRKITPGDARPMPEKNGLDEQTIIRRCAPTSTSPAAARRLTPRPRSASS